MWFGADRATRQDNHGGPEFRFARQAVAIDSGSRVFDGHRHDAAHLSYTIERQPFAGWLFLPLLLHGHVDAVGPHRGCMSGGHHRRRRDRANRLGRLQSEETAQRAHEEHKGETAFQHLINVGRLKS